MSFWNIKNHEKRDAMVEDYLATVKHIQQRSENEKLGSLAQRTLLEENYRSIVRSQEKASKEIVKGLVEEMLLVKVELLVKDIRVINQDQVQAIDFILKVVKLLWRGEFQSVVWVPVNLIICKLKTWCR